MNLEQLAGLGQGELAQTLDAGGPQRFDTLGFDRVVRALPDGLQVIERRPRDPRRIGVIATDEFFHGSRLYYGK